MILTINNGLSVIVNNVVYYNTINYDPISWITMADPMTAPGEA
jgi:hypothetical protein